MRTMLCIDKDILQAVSDLAHRQKKTRGRVISELLRKSLTAVPDAAKQSDLPSCFGFRPFPNRGRIVTNEAIDALRTYDAY